ncbi:alpha/beta hydrolase [Elstera cyanobacteriorum]|nr:alpha/beta hydrolase [Elstera cyanobacteriorum]GFZ77726.1 alpha/beta hydrolase [Elstera cyanobacteriorum]
MLTKQHPYAGGGWRGDPASLDRLLTEFLERHQSLPDPAPQYEMNSVHGHPIAFRHRAGAGPQVLFIGGFRSAMSGIKARWLDFLAAQWGFGFTRFDPLGHGETGGDFLAGDISVWRDDALTMLDRVAQGQAILIGSSMGGWLMTLLALRRPERLAGLIGIASAPDFTQRIEAALTAERRAALARDGVFFRPSAYGAPDPISARLLASGRENLVLDRAHSIHVPIRLLHGTQDADVPYDCSLALAQKLTSPDLRLLLLAGGDHRLSHSRDLVALAQTLAEVGGDSAKNLATL